MLRLTVTAVSSTTCDALRQCLCGVFKYLQGDAASWGLLLLTVLQAVSISLHACQGFCDNVMPPHIPRLNKGQCVNNHVQFVPRVHGGGSACGVAHGRRQPASTLYDSTPGARLLRPGVTHSMVEVCLAS